MAWDQAVKEQWASDGNEVCQPDPRLPPRRPVFCIDPTHASVLLQPKAEAIRFPPEPANRSALNGDDAVVGLCYLRFGRCAVDE